MYIHRMLHVEREMVRGESVNENLENEKSKMKESKSVYQPRFCL